MHTFFAWAVFFAVVCTFTQGAEDRSPSACTEPVVLNASENIWLNYTLHPHSLHRPYYLAAAELINDTKAKSQALKVAETGTFLWMYVL